MRLTPLAIRKQQFKKAMRGYDSVEVDTFLEQVADDYEQLLSENEQLNKKMVALETELRHFKEVEKTLKETLYNVQETSQLSKENSLKEAELIKKEAELAASQMIDKAREDVRKMKEELKSLRQQKESFIARLRHLLSSQLELLEVLEVDDEEVAKLKDRTKSMVTAQRRKKTAQVPKEPNPAPQPKPPAAHQPANDKPGKELFDDIFDQQIDIEGEVE